MWEFTKLIYDDRMLVLADELLENFFDHEFAQSFKLVEKPAEQQRSLGREIFDSLLATGTKFANNAKQKALVSSPLSSKASNVSSPTTSDTQSISTTSLSVNPKQDEKEDIDTTPQEPIQHDEAKKQEPTSSKSGHGEEEAASSATESPKKEHTNADEKKVDDVEDSNDEDEDEDVLEEVDRLLKEYGDDDEEEDDDAKST